MNQGLESGFDGWTPQNAPTLFKDGKANQDLIKQAFALAKKMAEQP